MNPMKKLGKSTLKVNGQMLQSYPGATCDIGGVVRTERVGHEVHGFSEQDRAGSIECEIDLGADTSLTDLQAIDDATVIFETDVGITYVGNHWWCAGEISFTDGGDSKVKLKFVGPPMQEMK